MKNKRILLASAASLLLVLGVAISWAGVLSADLSVTKTDGAASSVAGDSIVYTIVASNAGPTDVTGATVTDTFPATLTGCSWTCAASAGSTCTAAGTGDISDAVSLLVNGTATYTATCDIDPAATGTLDNTVTITPPGGITDPNPADNSATDSNTLGASADLFMTMAITPDPPTIGEPFSIEVTVSNVGPSDAEGAVATMTMPAGATLIGTVGCAEDPNGVPTCSLGTVPAGQMSVFTIQAMAPATAGAGTVDGSVSATTPDPAPGDNSVSLPLSFVVPIPTAGGWTLILMAVLFVVAALWRLR